MASMAPRNLKIGTIIDKTLGVLEYSVAPALIYLTGLTVFNGTVTFFSLESSPMQHLAVELLKFVAGVVAAYWLLEAMLRKTGLRSHTKEDVFFPYFGLSIVYALGVMLGMILLVIPGLLIMARWSIAQPLIIARGEGVMQALGESWERTRGNEFQILAAALILLILLIAVIIACRVLFDQTDVVGIAVSQLATSATSLISLALGVALFGLIEGRAIADIRGLN